MRRESLDTNTLLRLVLQDVPEQSKLVQELLKSSRVRFFVSDVALTEFVYVLGSHYGFNRSQIKMTAESLLSLKAIDCNRELTYTALNLFVTHKSLSYEDCYLASSAKSMNAAPLWTFDRALAAKAESAQLLA